MKDPRVHASLPMATRDAVRIAANSLSVTTSQLVREAIIAHLSLIIAPLLRDRAESGTTTAKMADLAALNAIRTGITACSTPGRKLRARQRGLYASHCAHCARSGVPKPTFAAWSANHMPAPLRTSQPTT